MTANLKSVAHVFSDTKLNIQGDSLCWANVKGCSWLPLQGDLTLLMTAIRHQRKMWLIPVYYYGDPAEQCQTDVTRNETTWWVDWGCVMSDIVCRVTHASQTVSSLFFSPSQPADCLLCPSSRCQQHSSGRAGCRSVCSCVKRGDCIWAYCVYSYL